MSKYKVDPSGVVALGFDGVEQFIANLRNPEFLLDGCRRFVAIEPRDSVYTHALNDVRISGDSFDGKAAGVCTLLLSWNEVYYRERQLLFGQIVPDLTDFLRVNSNRMNGLGAAALGRLTNDDLNVVSQLFKNLSVRESIGTTGAAKALHLLSPAVFVMWDTRIREAYHDFYHVHNKENHGNGDASCYASFMSTHNQIAGALLQSENDLVRRHPVFVQAGIRRSIAKMLDEANYARFTKFQTW